MTRTVGFSVYCDNTDGERDLFGVFTEHRPDLPTPIDPPLQNWVKENYDGLEIGDSIEDAGEMEYEPNEKIIEFRALE